MLAALSRSCRVLLTDRQRFEGCYLAALGAMVPPGHPLRERRDTALQLLHVVLRAVVSGDSVAQTEAECVKWGERLASQGVPLDSYRLVGFAVSRTVREIAGEAWSCETGSQWSAVQLWVVDHLLLGARRGGFTGPGAA